MFAAPLLAALLASPLVVATPELPITVVAPGPRPFATRPRPDAELAQMRGGMVLPNGFAISIGIDIQTRVDGLLVLHTIYASDGPIIGTRLFTDGTDGPRLAPATVSVDLKNVPAGPEVAAARNPAGPRIVTVPGSPSTIVNLVNGPQATWLTAEGQQPVPAEEGGPPVTTGPGMFSLSTEDGTVTARLIAPDLEVRHLIGRATGTIIANAGDNRAIDTISSVNIDLEGGVPVLSPSLLGNFALARDALRGR